MDNAGWELFLRSTDAGRPREKLVDRLAAPDTRAWVHAGLLLAGAATILYVQQIWQGNANLPQAADKAAHYRAGQVLATTVFFVAYFCTIARILLTDYRSVVATIIWSPLVLLVAAVAGIGFAIVAGAAKELLDLAGSGGVDWIDFSETASGAFAGAASIAPGIAVVMALTPLFVPLDVLLQVPRLVLEDVQTGVVSLDEYLRASRAQPKASKPCPVLLVEDDIHCATTALNYCAALGLGCHHVATIAEAERYLEKRASTTRLILLDNFVRVDAGGRNTTGSQWLEMLEGRFPHEERPFRVVVISGHIEAVDAVADKADLVLRKPWSPRQLTAQLRAWGIIEQEASERPVGHDPRAGRR